MIFDFEKFEKIAADIYPLEGPYSFAESMSVFKYFFAKYEEFMGEPHPPVRSEQIARICRCMPYIDRRECSGGQCADIMPTDYPVLIDKYFATKYRNCDYRICHFFSGRIRELKFYEGLY